MHLLLEVYVLCTERHNFFSYSSEKHCLIMIIFLFFTVGAVDLECSRNISSNASFTQFHELEIVDISSNASYGLPEIILETNTCLKLIASTAVRHQRITIRYRPQSKTHDEPSVFSENLFETKENSSSAAPNGDESAPRWASKTKQKSFSLITWKYIGSFCWFY